jgi:hypothetical protein
MRRTQHGPRDDGAGRSMKPKRKPNNRMQGLPKKKSTEETSSTHEIQNQIFPLKSTHDSYNHEGHRPPPSFLIETKIASLQLYKLGNEI